MLFSRQGWQGWRGWQGLRGLRVAGAVAITAGLLPQAPARAQAAPATLTVFAAADLGPVFRRLIPMFERSASARVILVPGSTGTLTQQIRNGAPADLFFAASEGAIDDLSKEGLLLPQSRALYARGRLVLASLTSSPVHPGALKDLADPRIRRIAIANPAHAPYGLAAQQALQAAGVWSAVQPKLVYGENIQQALQFVQSGSADTGIVARSLADTEHIVWTLVDPSQYAPLNQTAVVLARTTQPRLALSFLNFVKGPQGRAAMKQFGFLIPGEDF
jgi:molybdate transport system substrate-binding protein